MRNTHRDFVGLSGMKISHCAQITKFQEWSRQGYKDFHHNHYDWWAFPIDEPSSYGYKYVVLSEDINELKTDKVFMARYKRGLELIFESWGWSLSQACELPWYCVSEHQRWQVALKLHIHYSWDLIIAMAELAYTALQSIALGQVVRVRSRIRKHDALREHSSSARRKLPVHKIYIVCLY